MKTEVLFSQFPLRRLLLPKQAPQPFSNSFFHPLPIDLPPFPLNKDMGISSHSLDLFPPLFKNSNLIRHARLPQLTNPKPKVENRRESDGAKIIAG